MSRLIFPLWFKRQYPAPIDEDMVFTSTTAMDDYLSSGVRYSGQVATCIEEEGRLFILNNARTAWINFTGDGYVAGDSPTFHNLTATNIYATGGTIYADDTIESRLGMSALVLSINPDGLDGTDSRIWFNDLAGGNPNINYHIPSNEFIIAGANMVGVSIDGELAAYDNNHYFGGSDYAGNDIVFNWYNGTSYVRSIGWDYEGEHVFIDPPLSAGGNISGGSDLYINDGIYASTMLLTGLTNSAIAAGVFTGSADGYYVFNVPKGVYGLSIHGLGAIISDESVLAGRNVYVNHLNRPEGESLSDNDEGRIWFHDGTVESGSSIYYSTGSSRFNFDDTVNIQGQILSGGTDVATLISAGGGGITEHHDLGGLFDNDHPQYRLTATTIDFSEIGNTAHTHSQYYESGDSPTFHIINSTTISAAGACDFGVVRSKGAVYINYDGPDGNSNLYFYDGLSSSGKYLLWDDSENRFEFNSSLNVDGLILSGGTDVATLIGSAAAGVQQGDSFTANNLTVTGSSVIIEGDSIRFPWDNSDKNIIFDREFTSYYMTFQENANRMFFGSDVYVNGNLTSTGRLYIGGFGSYFNAVGTRLDLYSTGGLNVLSSLSASTYYCGATKLEDIFGSGGGVEEYTDVTFDNITCTTLTTTGSSIHTTDIDASGDISGSTYYCGSTKLEEIFGAAGGTILHASLDGLLANDHPQYALTGSNVQFANISSSTIYSSGDTLTLNHGGSEYISKIIFEAQSGAPLNDGILQYDSAGTGKFLIDNDLRVSGETIVIGDGGGLTSILLGDELYSDGYIIGGFPADTVAIGPILKTPTLSADTIYSGSVDLATLLGGGVSVHGDLTGLDANDHPQYALTGSNVEFDTITGTQIYITDEYLRFEGGTDGYIRYRISDNRFICVRPWQIYGAVSGENFYATANLHSNNNLYLDYDGNGSSSSVFFHDGVSTSGSHIKYVNADNSFNINKPVMMNNPIVFTGSGSDAFDVVRPSGGFVDSAYNNRQIHITFPDTVNWWSSEAMITMELTVSDNSSTGGSAKIYIHGKPDFFTVDEGVPVNYARWENTSVKVVSTDTSDRYDVSFCASASLSSSATSPILAIGTLTSDWNARITIDRVMVNDANIAYEDVVSGWTVEYSATEPFSAHTTHTNDPGVVTDHGSLTGLLDNDHPQYRLTATTIDFSEIGNTGHTHSQYYESGDNANFLGVTANTLYSIGATNGGIIISRGNIYVNYDGTSGLDGDGTLYFYDGGDQSGQYLRWDDSVSYFLFSTDINVSGQILSGGTDVASLIAGGGYTDEDVESFITGNTIDGNITISGRALVYGGTQDFPLYLSSTDANCGLQLNDNSGTGDFYYAGSANNGRFYFRNNSDANLMLLDDEGLDVTNIRLGSHNLYQGVSQYTSNAGSTGILLTTNIPVGGSDTSRMVYIKFKGNNYSASNGGPIDGVYCCYVRPTIGDVITDQYRLIGQGPESVSAYFDGGVLKLHLDNLANYNTYWIEVGVNADIGLIVETANAAAPATPDYSLTTYPETIFSRGDVKISDGDLTVGGNSQVGGNLLCNGFLSLNNGGPEGDSNIYFYDGGSSSGAYLRWDDSASLFLFNKNVKSSGALWSQGNLISDGNVFLNYVGSDGDSYLYFYEGGSATGRYLKWDDADSRFEFNDGLSISGDTTISGGSTNTINLGNATITNYDSLNKIVINNEVQLGSDISTPDGTLRPTPFQTKTVSILEPQDDEEITVMCNFGRPIVISRFISAVRGSSPSVTWNISTGSSRSSLTQVHSNTTTSTSSDIDSVNISIGASETFIVFKTSATGGTIDELTVTMRYQEDWS